MADLACPLRRVLREGDRTALTAAGAGPDPQRGPGGVLKPVVIAAAVVRRDGNVQAGGHPADHARLGVLEQQLDEMTGQHDMIGQVAARVKLAGKVKGTARRCMTTALTLRAVLLMTLMPEAYYTALMKALLGDLAGVPWHIPFAVPTATVLSTWREQPARAGPAAAGHGPGRGAGHEASDDYRAVPGLDLDLGAVDGTLTRTPDTPGEPGRVRVGRDRPMTRLALPAAAGPAGQRRLHPRHPRRADRPVRRGQGRGRADTTGPGAGRVPLGVHQGPAVA